MYIFGNVIFILFILTSLETSNSKQDIVEIKEVEIEIMGLKQKLRVVYSSRGKWRVKRITKVVTQRQFKVESVGVILNK